MQFINSYFDIDLRAYGGDYFAEKPIRYFPFPFLPFPFNKILSKNIYMFD